MRPRNHTAELVERIRDGAEMRTLCAFCDWSHVGTAAEGRTEHRRHRWEAHRNKARQRTRRKPPVGKYAVRRLKQSEVDQLREDRRKRELEQMLETVLRGRARRAAEEAA